MLLRHRVLWGAFASLGAPAVPLGVIPERAADIEGAVTTDEQMPDAVSAMECTLVPNQARSLN